MAKRTSKKVRKVKNAKATPVAVSSAAEISNVESPPSDQTVTNPNSNQGGDEGLGTIDQLTLEQAQTVGADAVGLTPSTYVYAEAEEPALEDVIDAYLTPAQRVKVREDAMIERFGKPRPDGREAIVSRIDSKLKEL